jgi:peptidyl-prolyl cis-trans isomerase B (cyclophilin B)
MSVTPLFAVLFSVLVPTKMWYGVDQPDEFRVESKDAVTLVLTDFSGRQLPATGSADTAGGSSKDVKTIFPQLSSLGTYVLYAVPKGKSLPEFVGTPVVIEVRGEKDGPNKPAVTRVEPLRYAVMQTAKGPLTMIFYYDVAPVTVDSFLDLASQGYFDGLTFHRIVPGFVIQGGDPRGDGSGGPGYSLNAEFNNRPHEAGVLSMARTSDPNSAGSQFFVCLNYDQTRQLDGKYTAFGKVVDGMDAVNQIAQAPLADPQSGSPREPQVIQSVMVKAVTAQDNPYKTTFQGK